MDDSSHGSAYLNQIRVAAQRRDHCVSQLTPDLRVDYRQHAPGRAWITRAGSCAATVPVWRSRQSWLDDVAAWAHSPALGALCRDQRVSITAPTLLAVATVMAGHADHATGRHVAVTRATIGAAAGCSPDTVTVAWRVLRTARWAFEAQRGHGSPATPSVGRRPSIYHLIPQRPARRAVEFPDLPRSGVVDLSCPVGTYSPSAPPARRKESRERKPRPERCAPRPLALQRLAAEVINRCHGLGHAHAGGVCDALTGAGIDPQIWTARQITAALNADMRTRGWSWPDHIDRPGAFLASRLRRLDWQPGGPLTKDNNDGGCAAGTDTTTGSVSVASGEQARRDYVAGRERGKAALSQPGHAAAFDALAAARHRRTRVVHRSGLAVHNPLAPTAGTTPVTASTTVAGDDNAP